jgi:molecular chaperone GrpE
MKQDNSVDITPENISPEVINPEVINPTEIKPDVIEPNYKELYTRSLADYDNMKKRYDKQIADMARAYMCNAVKSLVAPIYNDLQRGVNNGVDGCEIMLKNLTNNLEKEQFKVIGSEIIGKTFNTDYMEAVTSISTEDEQKKGKVSDVMECGVFDEKSDKTCVYAKVIVFN